MGYQNGNDNSQESYNEKQINGTFQRTSKTAEKAQDTTKDQYWRLNGSGKPVGTGE